MHFASNTVLSIAFILVCCLNWIACSRCPKDEKLGELALQAASREWLPYESNTTLVFVNESGDVLRFALPSDDNWQARERMVVDVPCSKGSFLFPREQLLFYDVEDYNLFLASEAGQQFSLIYHLRVYQLEDLPGQDTLLVDYLEASAQFDGAVASLYQVTSTRSNPAIEPVLVEEIKNVHLVGDTTLLGRPFEEVYVNARSGSNPPNRIFFNKNKGIIGIHTAEDLWVLDRTE